MTKNGRIECATVIFNREHGVSGAHPVEGYKQILAELMAQANQH